MAEQAFYHVILNGFRRGKLESNSHPIVVILHMASVCRKASTKTANHYVSDFQF